MGSNKVQVITFRARLATEGQYADDVEKKDRAARATTTFTTSIVGRAKGCCDLKWCRTELYRHSFDQAVVSFGITFSNKQLFTLFGYWSSNVVVFVRFV